MLGETCNWVRNVRAADGLATIRHGRARACRLVEVPVEERAPILKRHLAKVPGARPHVPIDRHAPLAEFATIAAHYPAFRVETAPRKSRDRLTLVSSFSSHDIDPDRVTKAGARLLADYLEYASSGGTAVGAPGSDELNPFEAGVRDRLAEFEITVVPQYGVGGCRIDFAAAHPQDQPEPPGPPQPAERPAAVPGRSSTSVPGRGR